MQYVTGEAAAIGIIGGADGPTAIFLSSKISWGNSLVFQLLSVFLLSLLINYTAMIKLDRGKSFKIGLIFSVVLVLLFSLIVIYSSPFNFGSVMFAFLLFLNGYMVSEKCLKN